MKKIICLALVPVLVLSMLCGCSSDKKETETTELTETVKTYAIEAAGVELKYPDIWKDKVTVNTDESKAEFSCGDVKLFDLLFDSDDGIYLGTLTKDGKETKVSVISYDIDYSVTELAEMQDDVNVIIENLKKDYDFDFGEKTVEEEEPETFTIDTPVTKLYYPVKWQDKVSIEKSDDKILFTCGEMKLFDIIFGESEDGYLLGTYKETPIYVIHYELPEDADEETFMMQEDINVILKHLTEDEEFVINTVN